MKTDSAQINLVLAWLWITLGFVSGLALGLFFHREDWLGGYASFKRRLYRLAHISFFGLGAVNLLFWLTVNALGVSGSAFGLASWAMVIGAVSMPICCVIMAHHSKTQLLFAVPIISLLMGGALTIFLVATANRLPAVNQQTSTLNLP